MVVYNPRLRQRHSHDSISKLLLDVESAFDEMMKTLEETEREKVFGVENRDAIVRKKPSVPPSAGEQILQLANKLVPSEMKLVRSRFHRVAAELLAKKDHIQLLPKPQKCCNCADAKFVVHTREEVILDYLCHYMKKIIIRILDRSSNVPQGWISGEDRTWCDQRTDPGTIMTERAFSSQIWPSSSSSSSSSSSLLGSSSSKLSIPEEKGSNSSSLSSLPLESSSSEAYQTTALDSPRYSPVRVTERSVGASTSSTFSDDESPTSMRESCCSNEVSSSNKSSTCPEGGHYFITSYEALTMKVKRNVATQTEERRTDKRFFGSLSTKSKTSKKKTCTYSTVFGEVDSLPRRLGAVLRSNDFFKSKTDATNIQIRWRMNSLSESGNLSKRPTTPFRTEELISALKDIEHNRDLVTDSTGARNTKDTTTTSHENSESLLQASCEQRRMNNVSVSSSSNSSLSSSSCSSPNLSRPRLFGSDYSIFTISGHLTETSEYTGKYSFKSYSVAHCN